MRVKVNALLERDTLNIIVKKSVEKWSVLKLTLFAMQHGSNDVNATAKPLSTRKSSPSIARENEEPKVRILLPNGSLAFSFMGGDVSTVGNS